MKACKHELAHGFALMGGDDFNDSAHPRGGQLGCRGIGFASDFFFEAPPGESLRWDVSSVGSESVRGPDSMFRHLLYFFGFYAYMV